MLVGRILRRHGVGVAVGARNMSTPEVISLRVIDG